MGCVTSFQLPVSKDDWDAYLSECSGDIAAARTRIVNEAVDAARLLVDAWVSGERITAQDAAMNRLMSDHAPDISDLISDPRLLEWSHRLLEVMKHHFTESLVTEASSTLPTHLSDRLDAERQAKLDAAQSAARDEAKRLYYAELSRLQSGALEEASCDFEAWKISTLIPEWQAKEAAAKAEKLQELEAFQRMISVELEEHKENARITAAKSLVHSKTEQRSRRQDRRANPVRASRSVSCVRSPSPSPSQKLDKTPTKADFMVSSQTSSAPLCAPVSDHARGRAGPSVAQEVPAHTLPPHIVVPLAGPDIAKASVGTLGDAVSGLPSTPTSCLPEALPSAAPLETASLSIVPDVVMALAAPVGDTRPSSARPVSGPEITSAVHDSPSKAPLVERYQSVTLSPASQPAVVETMEDRLVRLLGTTITAALVPVQSSIDAISSRLRAVEDTQNWAPGDDDGFPEGFDPATHGYDYGLPAPRADAGGEEHVDYHVESAPSRAAAEDADMEDARRRFESHDDNEDSHPFFEMAIMTARNQARHEMDPAHLSTLAALAAEDWEDFCSKMHIDRLCVPPVPLVADAFVTRTRVNLVQAQMESDLSRNLRADRGSSVSPDGPSYTGPYLSTSRDDPVALPRPSRLSEPVSISSDGSKISGFTETSPAPHTRPAGSALDLDTPPPGDGVGWSVMGGKRGRSFASIAAARPNARPAAPSTLPPSAAQAAHSFLTKPQLDSLSRAQVVSAYNARFTPKLPARVSKDNAVAAFLDKASRPAPAPAPSPKPISKTEYTLVYDTRAGDLSAPSGHRGDAASYVHAIQKHVKDAGTKQAELIGGRWTSQTSCNFVLTFNGNPSLDEVLCLCSTFAWVLGPHYSIVPLCYDPPPFFTLLLDPLLVTLSKPPMTK